MDHEWNCNRVELKMKEKAETQSTSSDFSSMSDGFGYQQPSRDPKVPSLPPLIWPCWSSSKLFSQHPLNKASSPLGTSRLIIWTTCQGSHLDMEVTPGSFAIHVANRVTIDLNAPTTTRELRQIPFDSKLVSENVNMGVLRHVIVVNRAPPHTNDIIENQVHWHQNNSGRLVNHRHTQPPQLSFRPPIKPHVGSVSAPIYRFLFCVSWQRYMFPRQLFGINIV